MELLLTRCPWFVGGPALALLVISLQWSSNSRLGMTGTFGEVLELATHPAQRRRPIDWRVFLFLGVLFGGILFGTLSRFEGRGIPTFDHGQFDVRITSAFALKAVILAGAGLLIGFGSRLSGGCTSGAGLCGVPRLSKGSIATTATFVLVAMAAAQVIVRFFPAGVQ